MTGKEYASWTMVDKSARDDSSKIAVISQVHFNHDDRQASTAGKGKAVIGGHF